MWPECFHMDQINLWRGLVKFISVRQQSRAEQRRLLPFQWSKLAEECGASSAAQTWERCARSSLPVLCGLTLPVFSSLDSDQRPVLREMKEKQVRAVSGTSTRSLKTAILVPFDALTFFFLFRRWGGKGREATLRYDSIWSLYSLTLKKTKKIKDGCCFMTSCSYYPHSLPYPEVTTQIYPTKIKMFAHFLSCLVKKYWNYYTEFYVLQNKCPTFTYKPIYI